MRSDGSNRGGMVIVAIGVVFAAVVLVLVVRPGEAGGESPSQAESARLAAVTAFPIKLSANSEGIALIDREHRTLCIYEYRKAQGRRAGQGLVLLAARSFRYDSQLEDYNTGSPRPDEIRQLLERGQRSYNNTVEVKIDDTVEVKVDGKDGEE